MRGGDVVISGLIGYRVSHAHRLRVRSEQVQRGVGLKASQPASLNMQ